MRDVQDVIDVYNMLEDDESKDIYLKRLNYLVTGDDRYIMDIVKTYLPHLWPEESMQDLLNSLPKGRAFVMYGAGGDGRRLLPFVQRDERFVGFCSSTKSKQENGYCGYPVMSPEKLLKSKNVSVVISTHLARDEILKLLKEWDYPEDLVFDGSAYYTLQEVGQYFNPKFMKYEDEEVFIDVGSYDLTTSIRLKDYCKHVKKVYAFEPDPKSYERCVSKKKETSFVEAEIFPLGTWSKRGTMHFSATGKCSAAIETGDGIAVSVVPIDEIVDSKDKITMIKMDVEGAELESLKGAKETIRRDKPKLAICIYHKLEDMTEIPLYIKGLVPEYKFHIRHHSMDEDETVLYAIMPE